MLGGHKNGQKEIKKVNVIQSNVRRKTANVNKAVVCIYVVSSDSSAPFTV